MSDDLNPTSKRIDPAYIEELLDSMDADAAAACLKMIDWLAERPQDAPKLSQDEMMRIVEETRLEIIRRRLGGVVGQVIPFNR